MGPVEHIYPVAIAREVPCHGITHAAEANESEICHSAISL
jgi:hypothetical protein